MEVTGPRVEAAYDSAGKPTRALEGFARAQGVDPEQIRRVMTPKGECVAARRRVEGRSAAEVLSEAIPAIVGSIPFGKTMKWGEGSFRFARPIHWIVCLLGAEIVPFQVAGIASGRTSRGARFEGSPGWKSPMRKITWIFSGRPRSWRTSPSAGRGSYRPCRRPAAGSGRAPAWKTTRN